MGASAAPPAFLLLREATPKICAKWRGLPLRANASGGFVAFVCTDATAAATVGVAVVPCHVGVFAGIVAREAVQEVIEAHLLRLRGRMREEVAKMLGRVDETAPTGYLHALVHTGAVITTRLFCVVPRSEMS